MHEFWEIVSELSFGIESMTLNDFERSFPEHNAHRVERAIFLMRFLFTIVDVPITSSIARIDHSAV